MRLLNEPALLEGKSRPESPRVVPRVDVDEQDAEEIALTSKEQALRRLRERERAREGQLSPAHAVDTLADSETPRDPAMVTVLPVAPAQGSSTFGSYSKEANAAGAPADGREAQEHGPLPSSRGPALPMDPGTFVSALPEAAGISSGSWVRHQVYCLLDFRHQVGACESLSIGHSMR